MKRSPSMLNITLMDCGSSKVPEITSALLALRCRVQVVPLAAANEHDLGSCDAVVISGGPRLLTDSSVGATLKRQFQFLDALELPVLGICLGHQGLGVRSGAQVYLGPERRSTEIIVVHQEHPLFYGLPPRFPMRADHCEGIPLPAGFRRLASSEHYEVEAMASSSRPHFGVQFHPEISGEPGRIVLENFCQMARVAIGRIPGDDLP